MPTGPIPRLTSPFVFPKHEISLDQPARPRSSVSDGNPSSSSSLTHQPTRQRQASKARQQAAAAATRRNGRQQRNATQASRRQAASDGSERTTDGHARVGPYSWLVVVVYGGSARRIMTPTDGRRASANVTDIISRISAPLDWKRAGPFRPTYRPNSLGLSQDYAPAGSLTQRPMTSL